MELQPVIITKLTGGEARQLEDVVAVEAGYQVYLDGEPVCCLTCTPRDLEELVTGALFCSGHICAAEQIAAIKIGSDKIRVVLATAPALQQSAGCLRLAPESVCAIAQAVFSDPDTLFYRTGCAHGCALVRQGEVLCVREDIGRHNALDKVIGYALRSGISLSDCAVFTSGRISGDYMEKMIRAGVPVAVSRAAVTSEAIRRAKERGVQLYGFVRGNSANLYAG